MGKDNVKTSVSYTPPVIGTLLGVKSTHTATDNSGNKGHGDSKGAAIADLKKK